MLLLWLLSLPHIPMHSELTLCTASGVNNFKEPFIIKQNSTLEYISKQHYAILSEKEKQLISAYCYSKYCIITSVPLRR